MRNDELIGARVGIDNVCPTKWRRPETKGDMCRSQFVVVANWRSAKSRKRFQSYSVKACRPGRM